MRPALRIALAVAIPLATLAVQWAIWDYVKPYVWFLFYPAAFFSALLTGLAGGVVATLLSGLLVWFFFIPPHFSLALENSASLVSVAVFTFTGIGLSLVARKLESLNRSQAAADALREHMRPSAHCRRAAKGCNC